MNENKSWYDEAFDNYEKLNLLSVEEYDAKLASIPEDGKDEFLNGYLDAYQNETFDALKSAARGLANADRIVEAEFLDTLKFAAKMFAEEYLNGRE